MPIKIKSPNADEVWAAWKRKQDRALLEKHYKVKNTVFNLDDVTAAEFVAPPLKNALIYFKVKKSVSRSQRVTTEMIPIKKVDRVKFYQLSQSVRKAEWREAAEVPALGTLRTVPCKKCGGKGGVSCKRCKGKGGGACPDCQRGNIKCKKCQATGKITVEVEGRDHNNGAVKKKLEVRCPVCYGKTTVRCSKCNGTGLVLCGACSGQGLDLCPECEGYAVLAQYEVRPVPFVEQTALEQQLFASCKLGPIEGEIGREIEPTLLSSGIQGIVFKTPGNLEHKTVQPELGYYDGAIKKAVEEAKKALKELERDPEAGLVGPIYVFPLLELRCTTATKKKFTIYSLGADTGFMVFGKI
jgi:hypothetical protein